MTKLVKLINPYLNQLTLTLKKQSEQGRLFLLDKNRGKINDFRGLSSKSSRRRWNKIKHYHRRKKIKTPLVFTRVNQLSRSFSGWPLFINAYRQLDIILLMYLFKLIDYLSYRSSLLLLKMVTRAYNYLIVNWSVLLKIIYFSTPVLLTISSLIFFINKSMLLTNYSLLFFLSLTAISLLTISFFVSLATVLFFFFTTFILIPVIEFFRFVLRSIIIYLIYKTLLLVFLIVFVLIYAIASLIWHLL